MEQDRLKVLQMAKDIVINEYIDKRAECHNKWLVESDHLWKTQKLRLAYPTIPPYPTEYDIIERANTLLEFLSNDSKTVISNAVTEKDTKDINLVEEVTDHVEYRDTDLPDVRRENSEFARFRTAEINEKETAMSKLVPASILKKIEDIKNNLG